MTDKKLDRLHASGQTVNTASLKLTEYLVPNQTVIQLVTRVQAINLASIGTDDRALSAIVTTTVVRKASGGPAFVAATSSQIEYSQIDGALTGVTFDYAISSNNVDFNVTGANTYTLQWLATTRPLVYTP